MDEQYQVVFEECGGHSAGAIVPGRLLARSRQGLEYLLRVGAIVAAVRPAVAVSLSDRTDQSDQSDQSDRFDKYCRPTTAPAVPRGGRARALKENVNG